MHSTSIPSLLGLSERLKLSVPLIADGALATTLYDKGFYINRSFEELSLTHPEAVQQATQEFKSAGAQVLHTNTFGASLPKLSEYGIQDLHHRIITKSVEITKAVANGSAWVLGAVGPLGVVLEPLGPTGRDEALEMFRQSVQIMEDSGVDGFSLLSFHDLSEMEVCVQAIRSVSTKPILSHIAVQADLKTSYGNTLAEFVRCAEKLSLDVVGIYGAVGPSGAFEALEKLSSLTSIPISLLPSAGLPRYVNDVYIYMSNPDYMAKFAKRMALAGARIIGGSSGVHPGHIKAISNSIRMVSPQVREITPQQNLAAEELERRIQEPSPLAQRSQLGQYLAQKEKIYSVEIVPPKGIESEQFLSRCQQLVEGGIKFVNIPDGARATARMSSLHIAAFIARNFPLDPIAHFTCRDRNLLGLQSDLLGAFVNGVRNILAVTGDPPKLGNCPDATAVYDVDAIGLTHILSNMNRGLDLGNSSFGKPSEFVVSVALNPTAHNQELELKRYNYKIEAGADMAVTQPIYDIEAYEKFMSKVSGPQIPVIMGVWPLVSLRNAEFLKYEVPGVEVPDWALVEMEKAGDNKEEAIRRGIDIAHRVIDSAQNLVAGFQVSAPFNKVEIALGVINAF
jgi:homocysteine S-methyltransferase